MPQWFWKCGLGLNFVINSGSFHKRIQMFQIHVYVLLTQMCLGQRTPLGATLLEARQADLLTSVRCQRYAAEDVGVINQSHYKAPFSTLAAESCVVIFTFCNEWLSWVCIMFLGESKFVLKLKTSFLFRQHKPDNPVLPSKKNVPNRPAPPYGKPWFSLRLFVCSCVFTWPVYLPESAVICCCICC